VIAVVRSIDEEAILDLESVHEIYCPRCGRKVVEWIGRDKPHVDPCDHVLFVYWWNSGAFLHLRRDVVDRLKQIGVELAEDRHCTKIRQWFVDTLILLKRALNGVKFSVYTLAGKPSPFEAPALSVGVELLE